MALALLAVSALLMLLGAGVGSTGWESVWAARSAWVRASGGVSAGSRQLGTITTSACRNAASPRSTRSSKPTVVRKRRSTAHTRKSKGATPGWRSPNTTQGTARWKGLMPSKATTTTRSAG